MSNNSVIENIEALPVMARYNLMLRGEQIELKRKLIPLELLHLDPKNQRIQFIMMSKGFSLTDELIDKEMWDLDHVKQLSNSIHQNGGLLSPLIVKCDGTVVEGNSRLVAMRHLIIRCEAEGIEPPNEARKPTCEVLPDDFDDRKLLWLLGEWHIAGKHEWAAYEQAEYIYKMWKDEGQTYDNLVNQLRMSKSTIKQNIQGYELMKEYLSLYRKPKEIEKWSYFFELTKKKELADKVDKEEEFKSFFFELVASGGRNGDFKGENVRKLPEIISEPKAFKVLKDTKNFQEAYKAIEEKKERSSALLPINNCIANFETIELKDIMEMQKAIRDGINHPTIDAIKKLHKKIVDFSGLVGIDLDS